MRMTPQTPWKKAASLFKPHCPLLSVGIRIGEKGGIPLGSRQGCTLSIALWVPIGSRGVSGCMGWVEGGVFQERWLIEIDSIAKSKNHNLSHDAMHYLIPEMTE